VINEKTIISKNRKKAVEIASLTKIMTVYVSILIIERLKVDPKVLFKTVSKEAVLQFGTTADLKRGE
jgi:D-alanyl-D-alanine carboxypeptidase